MTLGLCASCYAWALSLTDNRPMGMAEAKARIGKGRS